MKTLRFINAMPPYIVDDVATFEDKQADKIVEKEYATEITVESTKLSKDK